jgi:hypothetical protein
MTHLSITLCISLEFGIPLTFACLREAASGKAGILTFEINNVPIFPSGGLFCLRSFLASLEPIFEEIDEPLGGIEDGKDINRSQDQ